MEVTGLDWSDRSGRPVRSVAPIVLEKIVQTEIRAKSGRNSGVSGYCLEYPG